MDYTSAAVKALPFTEGDTFTGRTLSAKLRDGQIDEVRVWSRVHNPKGWRALYLTAGEKDLRRHLANTRFRVGMIKGGSYGEPIVVRVNAER